MKSFVLTALLLCVCFFNFTHAFIKNWKVTAKGCVKCYGKRMPYVKIKLMDDDHPLVDDTMKTGRAKSTGCFEITGEGRDFIKGKPDPYIRVEYSYSGSYGKMEVEKILGINRTGKTGTKKYSRNINFGTINFNTIHCKAYVEFYKAMRNYKKRTGMKVPYSKLHVRTGVVISGGQPYSLRKTIRIPRKYKASKLTYTTAKHELAHTVRHTYDGNLPHFLKDVIKYKYLQHHHCGKKTNKGFAFNEGWAEFWAGQCYKKYGSSPTNYSYEGNVAKALRKLKKDCNASYKKMVLVLKANKKKIHSFKEYKSRYEKKYGKC